jgi:nucleoside 2-deoxyribosyltransferase
MFKVYLAGPISGQTYGACASWREYAKEQLADLGINGYSPLRGKRYLDNGKPIVSAQGQSPLSTTKGIMTRDHFDCTTADLLIVNFLEAKEVSVGTVMELAFAYTHQIPVICCVYEDDPLYKHPMVHEAIPFRVDSVEQAVDLAAQILLP